MYVHNIIYQTSYIAMKEKIKLNVFRNVYIEIRNCFNFQNNLMLHYFFIEKYQTLWLSLDVGNSFFIRICYNLFCKFIYKKVFRVLSNIHPSYLNLCYV